MARPALILALAAALALAAPAAAQDSAAAQWACRMSPGEAGDRMWCPRLWKWTGLMLCVHPQKPGSGSAAHAPRPTDRLTSPRPAAPPPQAPATPAAACPTSWATSR